MYSNEFKNEYAKLGLVRESQFRNRRTLVMDKVVYPPIFLDAKGLARPGVVDSKGVRGDEARRTD